MILNNAVQTDLIFIVCGYNLKNNNKMRDQITAV